MRRGGLEDDERVWSFAPLGGVRQRWVRKGWGIGREAYLGVGPSDDGDFEHVRVSAQGGLTREARDVLAARDDDVLPSVCRRDPLSAQ